MSQKSNIFLFKGWIKYEDVNYILELEMAIIELYNKGEKSMIKVEFLGPIARESIEVEVSSLSELSKILFEYEDIRPWLEKCAVAVNDKMVKDPKYPLENGDRVSILPPVCGG